MRSMTTSRVAAVVAGVLVLGIGIASAEDSPGDPAGDETTTTLEDGTTTTTGDEETTTTVESTTTTVEDDEEDGEDEGAESTELEGENHGAIVSEAAQDHSNDERCGNHGQWVRSVATGAEDCVVPPGLQETEGDLGEEDSSPEIEETSNAGRGRGNAGNGNAGNGNGRGPAGR